MASFRLSGDRFGVCVYGDFGHGEEVVAEMTRQLVVSVSRRTTANGARVCMTARQTEEVLDLLADARAALCEFFAAFRGQ